jgi:hypothetical protein
MKRTLTAADAKFSKSNTQFKTGVSKAENKLESGMPFGGGSELRVDRRLES